MARGTAPALDSTIGQQATSPIPSLPVEERYEHEVAAPASHTRCMTKPTWHTDENPVVDGLAKGAQDTSPDACNRQKLDAAAE